MFHHLKEYLSKKEQQELLKAFLQVASRNLFHGLKWKKRGTSNLLKDGSRLNATIQMYNNHAYN